MSYIRKANERGQTVETSDGVAISQETLANIETHSDVEFLLFDLA